MKNIFLFILKLLLLCTLLKGQNQIGQDIFGEMSSEMSGSAIATSYGGKRIIVGAPYNSENGTNAGCVRIYEENNGNWLQIGSNILGESSYNLFGKSVSMSSNGNIIAIAAPENDDNGTNSGNVRVFEEINGEWVQLGNNINGDVAHDNFGTLISLSGDGNRIVISTPNNDTNGNNTGQIKIFDYINNAWVQVGTNINGETNESNFGVAMSLSGDGQTLVVGIDCNKVKIYKYINGEWTQTGNEIVGELPLFCFGNSISISHNGKKMAINSIHYQDDGFINITNIYKENNEIWSVVGNDIIGEYSFFEVGSSISLSPDGKLLAVNNVWRDDDLNEIFAGHTKIYVENENNWLQFGGTIFEASAHASVPRMSIDISNNPNRLVLGYPIDHSNFLLGGVTKVFSLKGVTGYVYYDDNQNCLHESAEIGIANKFAIIQPGDIIVQTNDEGLWQIDSLPIGNYTITINTSDYWTTNCPLSQSFEITNPDIVTVAPSFGLYSTSPCPIPDVSIHMPFIRPCFNNQKIYVQTCNSNISTDTLYNAYTIVELDPYIIPTSASLPYTDLGNNQYQFNIGTLNLGECIDFVIEADVSCDAILGESLCIQAEIFPVEDCVLDSAPNPLPPLVNTCGTPWDKSSLSVIGYCQNDSIYFEITNTGDLGEGDMTCFHPIMVYVGGQTFYLDSIQLLGQETIIFVFEGSGESWHLAVPQHPLHPGNSNPNTTVENCGGITNPSQVNNFPLDDADPIIDIYCGIVTGSYDPNDKTGFPLGIGEENLVMPNQQMEYLIRFQNTGTDTAFTVIVKDTLEENFEIFSVTPGTASHNYEFRMYGPRVLEWTFNNILLPDSTTNEAASHGFLKFKVEQVADLSNGTELNNNCGIYFDFNEPIITNTTSHIIDDMIQDFTLSLHNINENKPKLFNVSPNPTTGDLTIELDKIYNDVNIKIIDITGRELSHYYYNDIENIQLKIQEEMGIYFIQINTNEGVFETYKIVKK